jgi:hypothetical protein
MYYHSCLLSAATINENKVLNTETCGLYNKHLTIVNDDSSGVSK